MKIGIIGKGKMGREIFELFLNFDYNIVLICRKAEDIEKFKGSIEKLLEKRLVRGYLDDSAYERKRHSFVISNDLSDFRDCNIIIESVTEDKVLKQNIFGQLDEIVDKECILATNTSSIPLAFIFDKCKKKDRCLGIHFFFPVKIIKTVEINMTNATAKRYVDVAREVLKDINKEPLELKESVNMIINKIFAILIAEVNIIQEENYLKMKEIDEVIREKLFTFGLFEMIDSIGLNVVSQSFQNFNDEVHEELFKHSYNKFKKIQEKGYMGGDRNKGILDYEEENPILLKNIDEIKLNKYKKNLVLRLQNLLINELDYIINRQYIEKKQINEAIMEVLGLSKTQRR